MEWLLEIVLVLMLATTIFHAFRLERALGVLKRDRAALEILVSGFNQSTRAAEQGIERLHEAADGAGRQVDRQITAANRLKDDLQFLNDRGERVADRLEAQLRTARPLDTPRVPMAVESIPAPVEEAAPPARLQSQAERDLMKALRLARA